MDQREYSTGERFAHIFTHLLGALISVYGIIILEANSKNTVQAISSAIFGGTLFFSFLSSSIYHSMTNEKAKLFFQKIDHSFIYILIAGTYTPALLMTIKFPVDVILLALVWFLAIMGIVFCCIKLKSKSLSTALYLLMGWVSLLFIYNVWVVSPLSVWLLLGGGIFYSIGCVFYLMKTRYMHFVWHLFVLAGAVMQYFAILVLLQAINLQT